MDRKACFIFRSERLRPHVFPWHYMSKRMHEVSEWSAKKSGVSSVGVMSSNHMSAAGRREKRLLQNTPERQPGSANTLYYCSAFLIVLAIPNLLSRRRPYEHVNLNVGVFGWDTPHLSGNVELVKALDDGRKMKV